MAESNYWVGTYVSPSSPDRSTIHQASKDFDIDLSRSSGWNPEIEITVARNDKFSIQVPKSTKYHKVKGIQEADFLQFFNQTLHYFQHLDINRGEYYMILLTSRRATLSRLTLRNLISTFRFISTTVSV